MGTITIHRGDTLWKIAGQLKAQGAPGSRTEIIARIARENGIANPNLIRAGRTLNVPDTFAPTASAGPASGADDVSTFAPAPIATDGSRDGQIAAMLDWAHGELGTPYAAVNPFRFGDVPWDGKPHPSLNGSGKIYNFPAGTRVYDCSGFVVAAFRQLGVDLLAKRLGSSSAIRANSNGFLRNIDPSELQPGDLITYQPKNGVGHVVIFLGDGKVIQSSGGGGVNIADLDWGRIQSCRRVPLP